MVTLSLVTDPLLHTLTSAESGDGSGGREARGGGAVTLGLGRCTGSRLLLLVLSAGAGAVGGSCGGVGEGGSCVSVYCTG